MGTRSFIIRKSENCFYGVYCHWDGQLSHNGLILYQHYKSEGKIKALMEKGDMSALGTTPSECIYYVDKGIHEDDARATKLAELNDLMKCGERIGAEFIYVFDGFRWSVAWRRPQYFWAG